MFYIECLLGANCDLVVVVVGVVVVVVVVVKVSEDNNQRTHSQRKRDYIFCKFKYLKGAQKIPCFTWDNESPS